MTSKDFENIIANWQSWMRLLFAFSENFLGKQADIDQADNPTLLIDYGKSEKFVEHEKLARIKNCRAPGISPPSLRHVLVFFVLKCSLNHPPCRQNAYEPFFAIDREK